ncbi:MAG: FISUMP domain-containing protein [Cyclobacteriaceae bacterium]
MKLKGLLTICCALFVYLAADAQEVGTMTDSRDGKEYKTVQLLIKMEAGITKKRTWLGQNLDYASPSSSCYKDEPAFCEAFGRLYPWEDAITVCPEGWHLPSEKEWTEVIDSYGGRNSAGAALRKGGEAQVDLVMGGFGNGLIYTGVGKTGSYWDGAGANSGNSDVVPRTAGLISIDSNNDDVFHVQIGKEHLLSVRCIENY